MEQSYCAIDRLNQISLQEAQAVVGQKGFNHLNDILKHLFSTLPDLLGEPRVDEVTANNFDYRYAPSVVARNEAELFGISSPRFAVRGSQSFGIFNLRRLQQLVSAVGDQWARRRSNARFLPKVKQPTTFGITPSQTFQKSNKCIADAVISGTVELLKNKGFRVLEANLGIPYGEGAPLSGVPYVEHIPLGGGLCAQAACLMCTLLLHHLSLGVHGAAEITALTVPTDRDEFMLSGMNPIQITKYFQSNQVRLASAIEIGNSEYFKTQAERITFEGLSAYIRSGLPAIIPVDSGRMERQLPHEAYAESIVQANRLSPHSELTDPIKPKNHAVVAVGARHRPGSGIASLDFLINDPSRGPLLMATGTQLKNARAYRDIKEQRNPEIADLAEFQFVSVRPFAVQFPLLSTVVIDSTCKRKKYLDGAIDASFNLLTSDAASTLKIPRLGATTARTLLPGVIRLALASCRPLTSRLSSFAIDQLHDLSDDCRSCLQNWVDREQVGPKWVWVQWITLNGLTPANAEQVMFVWNAEIPAQSTLKIAETPELFVLSAFQRNSGSAPWQECWQSPHLPDLDVDSSDPLLEEDGDELIHHQESPADKGASVRSATLKPSIMSSFAIPGFEAAVSRWPSKKDGMPFPCELYTFMRPTKSTDILGRGITAGQWASATEEMAARANTPGAIAEYANWFRKHLYSKGQQIPVVALASFIPEVTCQIDSTRWKVARDAIKFMLQFGALLANPDPNSPKLIIEIVAGSRIDGLWPGIGDDGSEMMLNGADPHYFANRMPEQEGITRLLQCLQQALNGSNLSPDDSRVAIALELEPGPLYLLNSLDAMKMIDDAILERNDPLLDRLVGFNLDIAHWNMAGIRPQHLSEEASLGVRRRVLHSHLSGHHGRAHLGDAPLDQQAGFGIRRSTIDWLDLLDELAQVHGRPFSVSLEYEAAKNIELLKRSSATLEWALELGKRTNS